MTARNVGYWGTTALVAMAMLSGGLAELTHQPGNIQGLQAMGYPAYVATILGFWKVPGALVLLVPRWPRLKEWAYAGVLFNLTGAAASHMMAGDAVWHVAVTTTLAALAVVSWALRPTGRVLGSLHPTAAAR